jgi:putative two-component system response regulator
MLGERKQIILVDDNPINLKLARNTLMGKYDVFTVPSAEKLFQLLEKTIPEIILLDVMMPGMSGYDTLEVLKSNPNTASVPVIFLTSKSDTPSELEGFEHGAVDYISKPFSPQLLLKRVDVHVDLQTAKKELKNYADNLELIVDKKTVDIQKLQNVMLLTMSDLVETRDDVTGSHLERTERILKILLEEMDSKKVYYDAIGTWDIKRFLRSAQLHDIGKIAVSDSILKKPSPLTPDEFEEMKKHTTFGEKVIDKIIGKLMEDNSKESVFLTDARIMAGTHHERWDGSGYPRGMAGFEIPLQGRLMSLVDVYDALVSERPYKKAYSKEEAIQIIQNGSAVHFDPTLVNVFIDAAQRFPSL